jgi:glutaconate CoA-transferase subunit B
MLGGMQMSNSYSPLEMMAIACSRRIKNSDTIFCGTGLPLLAVMTAKKTHAPNCVVFFETGALDPELVELPLSVADSRVMYGATHNGGLADAFSYMQNPFTGPNVIGILSGAQIDPYGNLNSTSIGDYENPSVRLPGSGGACDVASFVGRTFIFIKHERRRFVEKVDYITSPGWLNGGKSRQHTGLIIGGPNLVITSLGILGFDDETKRMCLVSRYENVSIDDIIQNTSFNLDISKRKIEPEPNTIELQVLRNEVDPLCLILNKKSTSHV